MGETALQRPIFAIRQLRAVVRIFPGALWVSMALGIDFTDLARLGLDLTVLWTGVCFAFYHLEFPGAMCAYL